MYSGEVETKGILVDWVVVDLVGCKNVEGMHGKEEGKARHPGEDVVERLRDLPVSQYRAPLAQKCVNLLLGFCELIGFGPVAAPSRAEPPGWEGRCPYWCQ